MVLGIWCGVGASIAAGVSDEGQIFGILLPGFSGRDQVPNDIVGCDRAGKPVVIGNDLPGGQHKVIADGRVRVRVVALSVAIGRRQAFQVWHVIVADDTVIGFVFFQHDEDVLHLHVR